MPPNAVLCRGFKTWCLCQLIFSYVKCDPQLIFCQCSCESDIVSIDFLIGSTYSVLCGCDIVGLTVHRGETAEPEPSNGSRRVVIAQGMYHRHQLYHGALKSEKVIELKKSFLGPGKVLENDWNR